MPIGVGQGKKQAMGIDDSLIQEIVRRVLTVSLPDRIILFGTAARGEMTPDSDIDPLVLEAAPAAPWERSQEIRLTLRGMGFPFDVIVMPTRDFEQTKDVVGGLAFPANKYGRVVYGPN